MANVDTPSGFESGSNGKSIRGETIPTQRPGQKKPPVFLSLDSNQPLPQLSEPWKSTLPLSAETSTEKISQQDTGESIRLSIETPDGKVWVEGNSLFCACPHCSAPVSVRMWLMTADCWRCDTRIQLTRDQEEAIENLLRKKRKSTETPAPAPAPEPEPMQPPVEPAKKFDAPEMPPRSKRHRRSAGQTSPVERMRRMRERRSAVARMREAFRMTPAWLISFLTHLILIIILLMLYFENLVDTEDQGITLSTAIAVDDVEGAEVQIEEPDRQLDYEAPLPRDANLADAEVRQALQRADQDAKELRVDDEPLATLPDLNEVRRSMTQRQGQSSRFVARDPRMRLEILKKEGGTSMTEAAVARGLRWLAKVQNHDGSWSLKNYKYYYRKTNKGDMAATALALLPFLGAGQTHEYGRYKETVSKGLKWIMDHQDEETGDLRSNSSSLGSNVPMYAHGQASIVLVEAYAITGDERFREPAQKAINFIVNSQRTGGSRGSRGGWRYSPQQVGDTSVFGWQMMALQSALSPQLGLEVPRTTLLYAADYLDAAGNRAQDSLPAGTVYSYQRRGGHTPAMTAEALLCRIYLGWKRDDPRLKIATEYLLDDAPPAEKEGGRYNLYYIYYATQLFHHYGGEPWDRWNQKMQDVLVNNQVSKGTYAGSFDPGKFRWGEAGQRIYTTSLAVCTLEVFYRHLPLFKQLDIDGVDEDAP